MRPPKRARTSPRGSCAPPCRAPASPAHRTRPPWGLPAPKPLMRFGSPSPFSLESRGGSGLRSPPGPCKRADRARICYQQGVGRLRRLWGLPVSFLRIPGRRSGANLASSSRLLEQPGVDRDVALEVEGHGQSQPGGVACGFRTEVFELRSSTRAAASCSLMISGDGRPPR